MHDGESSLVAALAKAGAPDMHPCHRIDAETTGVVMLAESGKKASEITAALASATKVYRGIVRGEMPLSGRSSKAGGGRWTQSVSPKAEGRKNPRGSAASRVEARTDYSVAAATRYLSVVDFRLRTGRTHQIRKHAACNSHHILGDTRYGDPKHAKQMARRFGYSGMALHAAQLVITIDGQQHTFEAPVPGEWQPLLAEFDATSLPPPGHDVGSEPPSRRSSGSRSSSEVVMLALGDDRRDRSERRPAERKAPNCV